MSCQRRRLSRRSTVGASDTELKVLACVNYAFLPAESWLSLGATGATGGCCSLYSNMVQRMVVDMHKSLRCCTGSSRERGMCGACCRTCPMPLTGAPGRRSLRQTCEHTRSAVCFLDMCQKVSGPTSCHGPSQALAYLLPSTRA